MKQSLEALITLQRNDMKRGRYQPPQKLNGMNTVPLKTRME